jgi:hypothetical protein
MSEILSGARYTFGGLVVLTLWSLVALQVVEWRLESAGREQAKVQERFAKEFEPWDDGPAAMGQGLK